MDSLPLGTIVQFSEGNPEAFRKVYDLFNEKIMTYCMRYVLSKESAEELVNDIFLRLWRNRGQIDPELGIKGFLYHTAKFETFSFLKKLAANERRKAAFADDYTLCQELVEHERRWDAAHDLQVLKQVIDTFPTQRRKIFEYCKFEGLSYAEVSELLNISRETVKKHMSAALKDLARIAKASDFATMMVITSILLKNK